MEQLQDKVTIPQKLDQYEDFIEWYALPLEAKRKVKIITQADFCKKFKLAPNTLTAWKRRPEFVTRVRALRTDWGFDRTSDVLNGMYKSALKGNDKSQKLWLQYFENFSEKTEQTNVNKVEIGVNDIRFLIEQLPEPMKSNHYANLRQLLDDVTAFRNAREAEDSIVADGPPQPLLGQTNQPAQHVPDTEADEVAEGDTAGVRENMVR